MITHAVAHGIPAPLPVPLPDGDTILERDYRFYALFPRLSGIQRQRGELRAAEVASAGTMLSRVHAALQGCSDQRVWPRPFAVDREATLARIADLERLIRARPALEPSDLDALQSLAAKRRLVEQSRSQDLSEIHRLEHQILHGDYQDANLLFDGGHVCAVLDWESTHVGPRLFELIRAMDYMLDLDPAACRAFLAAYRTILPIIAAEIRKAAMCYGVLQAHNLWLFQTLYVDGNERVRCFIRPGGFVPFEERWTSVAGS